MKHPVPCSPHRGFLFFCLVACLSLNLTQCSSKPGENAFIQAPLPFAEDALEPFMSAETLSFHYNKHHAAYVKNANALVQESPFNGKSPEDVVRLSSGKTKYESLFNQAAQAWNHSFFWNCLKPHGEGLPTGELLQKINESFGSFEQFKIEFITASKNLFGSGWVWLVQDKDRLAVITTKNADTPLAYNLKPLFAVDVWEHAYYLDYQNKRADFVLAVLEHLANWDYAASLLGDSSNTH